MNPWDVLIKVGRRVIVDGKQGSITAIRYRPYRVYVWFDGANRSVSVAPEAVKES